MEISLKAQARDQKGKGAARKARARGQVPAVLYGSDLQAQPLFVNVKEMNQALHTEAGYNVLITLKFDGADEQLTMLREVQRHPLRGDLLHVDFLKVARDVKIHANVPIHLVGESRGVKEGGVVEHHLWELSVEAFPTDVPPNIEVDISRLGIGDSVRVADVDVPSSLEILTDGEEMIAGVVEPQLADLPEAVLPGEEDEEAVEGEVPEGEEGAPPAGEGGEGAAAREEEQTSG
ncbi:MAG: 50S ribosomal protein L25/general stress protein Ctc [Actinobacteria bacterium]|nr:50S ribosomal protein L25/general stress protein Ctc [Actinomycetota bacterium]